MSEAKPCPCGSSKSFDACCLPHLRRETRAPTPEALMRSRYCAFCLSDMDYIEDTTHPEYRADFDREANATWAKQAKFTKLDILSAETTGDTGRVHFRAQYHVRGKPAVHEERSLFRREFGVWYFCEGTV